MRRHSVFVLLVVELHLLKHMFCRRDVLLALFHLVELGQGLYFVILFLLLFLLVLIADEDELLWLA